MLSPCFLGVSRARQIYQEDVMKHLNIAVGIIRNAQQEIFITRRAADSHMAGFWEFPGGKIEQGETPEQALNRELQEETGIETERAELLEVLEHRFSDRIVTLNFYLVEGWAGEPFGREGQPMRWVKQADLREEEFPEANVSIIKLLVAQANAAQ
ncbi:8-oxo-dGTP diphosphatase [Serratia quinivorans]|jgi:8-oxo-dGTP diphosphatase|nr:8-oxo-dGTP diphosphatase [Serratia proteamaculans]CAI0974337.1 8-oxo-dGTP diphosphatase [Serratia proteamaculans]CAI1562121.1 8-oxo-dGTP diphosphatase [Serratia proteamaculans]SPZ53203.1 8-oxo-dGTP diphosphatase [Serratia quinivorans]